MNQHDYPIELPFPDLHEYAEGNTGIPYVHSFDSGVPGAHTMINALTHGNEVCGAIVVKEMLDRGWRPRRGRITFAFANVEAYQRFDPARPDASRFVDQDFNRVWDPRLLDDLSRDSSELRRARAMRPLIDTVDFLLDLHSMHERSAPLNVCGPLHKGIALAQRFGAPANIVSDSGHAEGRRLRDYGEFGQPESGRNALLIECGQHWEAGALEVARNCCARWLLLCGNIDLIDLPTRWLRPQPEARRVVRVTDAVVADSMDFRFAAPYTGLEKIPEAGTVIGWNAGREVRTPYPNCVLVMPSLRQLRPGTTVVRLGQLLD
ncbi:MAG TPA: M14 family metallopeptidase [Telluria sp.]|nr:M14 family metallopeptidase [Telluria sp.]